MSESNTQQQQQSNNNNSNVADPNQQAAAAATSTATTTTTGGGTTVLGSLTNSASNAGKMVAGQVTGQVDSVLKSLHFSEYKSAVLAEFFGSFLLTMTVSLAQSGAGADLSPLAQGFMYASLIFSFGYISGGHFNPAITLGIWLSRDGPETLVWHKALLYWIFQLLGSSLAALYCLMVHGADFSVPTTPDTFYPGIFRVLITETVFTFVLVSVMLHCATSKQKENSFYGFAVGMTQMAATLANKGGVMNPATATALIVVKCFTGTCIPVLHLWVFWAGELIGCIFAAIFYNVASATLDEQEQQEKKKLDLAAEQAAASRQQDSLRFGDAPQDIPTASREDGDMTSTPRMMQQQQNQTPNQNQQGASSAPRPHTTSSQQQQPYGVSPNYSEMMEQRPTPQNNQQQQQQQTPSSANISENNGPTPQNNNDQQSHHQRQSSSQQNLAAPAPSGSNTQEEVSPLYQ